MVVIFTNVYLNRKASELKEDTTVSTVAKRKRNRKKGKTADAAKDTIGDGQALDDNNDTDESESDSSSDEVEDEDGSAEEESASNETDIKSNNKDAEKEGDDYEDDNEEEENISQTNTQQAYSTESSSKENQTVKPPSSPVNGQKKGKTKLHSVKL